MPDLEDVLFYIGCRDLSVRHDGFSYDLILSEPHKGYEGPTGLIDAEFIKASLHGEQIDMFYICGLRL